MSSSRQEPIGSLLWQLLAAVSQKCWQPCIYKRIFIVYVAFLFIKICIDTEYPVRYVWTETFINYEGGFLRRGLIGQILFWLAPWISPELLGLGLCGGAFLLFVALAYKYLSETLDRISILLIYFTPSCFVYFIRELDSLLRKDQFINLFSLLTVLATVKFIRDGKGSLWGISAIFLFCFGISFFIHEASVFYFTLPAWLLGLAWAREQKASIWFILMSVAFMGAGFIAIQFQGDANNALEITAAWKKYVPDFAGGQAFAYLGMPIAQELAETAIYYHDAVVMRSTLGALVLALAPFIWIIAAYRPFEHITRAFPLFMVILLPLASLGPWVLPTFACDFGRHIALASVQYILCIWAIIAIRQCRPRNWLDVFMLKMDNEPRFRIYALGVLAIYCSSWMLKGWAQVGHSILVLSGLPDYVWYLLH